MAIERNAVVASLEKLAWMIVEPDGIMLSNKELCFRMKFERVDYKKLSGKQQEIYNFQKVAGVLADYGFNCIKLADDWLGADFLAYHKDGITLKVQMKGRIAIDKKYFGKDLYIVFPLAGYWCLIEHDELVDLIGRVTNWLKTSSWISNGQYHSAKPSQNLVEKLRPYTLGQGDSALLSLSAGEEGHVPF